MKNVFGNICMILMVLLFVQSNLFSQTVQLDSAIDKMAETLKTKFNVPNRNIALIGLYGKTINPGKLNSYFKTALANKLSGSNISIIDQNTVDGVISENAWTPALKNDITAYYKISKSIFEQTGKSVSYFLFGTVDDQDDFISLSANVIEDESYSDKATFRYDIEATEHTDKLLGKQVTHIKN